MERRLDLALKHLEDGLAVERKADTKLALVLVESSLVPAGEDRAVVDNCLRAVGRNALDGDYLHLALPC